MTLSVARMRPQMTVTSLLLLAIAGCSGSSTTTAKIASPPASTSVRPSGGLSPVQRPVPAEKNPPGDIPDNLAFVAYRNGAGRYAFTHPEGWAETTRGSSVGFTDKLNGVQLSVGALSTPPTPASAGDQDVPKLKSTQAAFELRTISAAKLAAGTGVRIVYRRNSAPDPVTGRQYRDEVERYEIVSGGREVIVELYGPVGADNVDAYRTMIQSLRLG